ncbi:Ubiquitin-protein ligase E3B [Trichinella zimbabwensis]|uniref:Ubiquitin-protein ligase E3B n=1 Tax=Trichinella zimbabwensis TaxID=268475 RepID=A0A0V1HM79_9BILA|nr:Ubiquitin-protein ligase E3B [Trichinella zimbabwensis]
MHIFMHEQYQLNDKRDSFLERVRSAREQREAEQRLKHAATLIQALIRGFLTRRRKSNEARDNFLRHFAVYTEFDKKLPLISAKVAFPMIQRFVIFCKGTITENEYLLLVRYLLLSSEASDIENNMVIVALTPSSAFSWLHLMRKILCKCIIFLANLRLDHLNDAKLNLYLHLLLSFTSTASWAALKSEEGVCLFVCMVCFWLNFYAVFALGGKLRPSMNKLCERLLINLVHADFYPQLSKLLRNGLCRSVVLLKKASLTAVFSLSLRPICSDETDDNILSQYIRCILTTPALIWHLKHEANSLKLNLLNGKLLLRCMQFLCERSANDEFFAKLEVGTEVCILGNIVNMAYLEHEILQSNRELFLKFINLILCCCRGNIAVKKQSMSYWQPFFGWYKKPISGRLQEALPFVTKQIQLLWDRTLVLGLFAELCVSPVNPIEEESGSHHSTDTDDIKLKAKNLSISILSKLRKSTPKLKPKQMPSKLKPTQVAKEAVFGLAMYQNVLNTFSPLKYDVLSGLCYQDFLLPKIWETLVASDIESAVNHYLQLFVSDKMQSSDESLSFIVFFESATYLMTILDDYELFTLEKPFQVRQLISMAHFCNLFIFRSVWEKTVDIDDVLRNCTFNVVLGFLLLIYNRDCRRPFVPKDFWLMKDLKSSVFLNEVNRGNKKALFIIQRIPHVIPHRERIKLFRKYVASEKASLAAARLFEDQMSVIITIHRARIVEDGFRQLSQLPGRILKGIVRVKFINEQGLDEPGIDQDGVFKEFLEEVIKNIFDPALNLFKLTSEGHLYPSPTSYIHENYLLLFEFIGKMLGKAVYEGICVDILLASFFINHLIGRTASKYHSSIDELSSLDADLYKQLTFIKHYEGDMNDLGLTFACDEDILGEVVTHELRPGGRTIPVTKENKISYVHLMAHYRMFVQIKDQIAAFMRGFHAIISPEWLRMFSADEFQRLLSGDTCDIDLHDLRKHTQYFGGFHNNHRVIVWLWEILANDFSVEERRLFLKFVTSCSKPPLLGFEYLEPPFSIRCVEVNDDEDEGDTLGSVIRGFLAIRKEDPVSRLPTTSTCFNLLKLPNYHRKSTLRDKLRYAIHCGTGFELS